MAVSHVNQAPTTTGRHYIAMLAHRVQSLLQDPRLAAPELFALRDRTIIMGLNATSVEQTSTAQRGNVISVARRVHREPPRTVCTMVTPLKVPQRARVRM